jgi:lysophospholipase L1-like esterase
MNAGRMNLLEQEDFNAFFSGCLRTVQSDSGLLLHRHTAKQIAYYEETNESWAIRSRCPAGIKLNLHSHTRTLDLRLRILPGARTYAGFDVEVDGRTTAAIQIDTSDGIQSLCLVDSATPSQRQISITFPQSAIVELHAIEVEEDSQTTAVAAPQKKYLALGDSITQGMDARGPASAYAVQLARVLDVELLNQGVGGHIFDLDALDDELPYHPDIITIAYGTNDWSRDTTCEEISSRVERYLTRLKKTVGQSAHIYLLTPLWRATGDEVRKGGTLAQFSATIGETAATFTDVTVVDGSTLVPHLPGLFADGIHPTDEGFLHYTLNLQRAIQ